MSALSSPHAALSPLLVLALALPSCQDTAPPAPPDTGGGQDMARIDLAAADARRIDSAVDSAAADGPAPVSCNESHTDRTVGLIHCTSEASPGYTLLVPSHYKDTYLLDLRGRAVHTWKASQAAGEVAYLLPDGRLLRPAVDAQVKVNSVGGHGGRVQIFDWDSKLLWDYLYCKEKSHCQHHDAEVMPNGNVLIVAWEFKTRDEVIAAGVDSANLPSFTDFWVDYLVEVQPTGLTTGKVVWSWHLWDHMVQDKDSSKPNFGSVAAHPELFDINYMAKRCVENDLSHINALEYNATLDQIALSVLMSSEIVVIDHGTTTAEASGHKGGKRGKGGDILYRWGNPEIYGAGSSAWPRILYNQHDVTWIPVGYPGAGNFLVFNNRSEQAGAVNSSVEEAAAQLDTAGNYLKNAGEPYPPKAATWSYMPTTLPVMFTEYGGSSQRLRNGNTLLAESDSGRLFEVTQAGKVVWRYDNPVTVNGPVKQGTVFTSQEIAKLPVIMRVRRYTSDYAGLKGRALTPGAYVELPASVPAPDAGPPPG